MAFCQTIAHSRNELGNWVKFENMFTSTPGPCTAFRSGSCCDTEIGWKHNICNVVARCTTTHSKTLKKLHITGLAGDCHGWGGVGMEMGWRWGWGGDGQWGTGSVFYLISNSHVLFHFMLLYFILREWPKFDEIVIWSKITKHSSYPLLLSASARQHPLASAMIFWYTTEMYL